MTMANSAEVAATRFCRTFRVVPQAGTWGSLPVALGSLAADFGGFVLRSVLVPIARVVWAANAMGAASGFDDLLTGKLVMWPASLLCGLHDIGLPTGHGSRVREAVTLEILRKLAPYLKVRLYMLCFSHIFLLGARYGHA